MIGNMVHLCFPFLGLNDAMTTMLLLSIAATCPKHTYAVNNAFTPFLLPKSQSNVTTPPQTKLVKSTLLKHEKTSEYTFSLRQRTAAVYTPTSTQQEQTTQHRSTPHIQDQVSVNTVVQGELTEDLPTESRRRTTSRPSEREQTALQELARSRSAGYSTVTPLLTTEHRTQGQPVVTVTTQDVLDCMQRTHSPLTLQAEELWLNIDYTGNTTGSSRLHAPSSCTLQVRGYGQGTMSLLIFNVTCFTDNQMIVHSDMRDRQSYDCDPLVWMAPAVGLIMTSDVAVVRIEIGAVQSAFVLHARFKIIDDDGAPRLQLWRVTSCLG